MFSAHALPAESVHRSGSKNDFPRTQSENPALAVTVLERIRKSLVQ